MSVRNKAAGEVSEILKRWQGSEIHFVKCGQSISKKKTSLSFSLSILFGWFCSFKATEVLTGDTGCVMKTFFPKWHRKLETGMERWPGREGWME